MIVHAGESSSQIVAARATTFTNKLDTYSDAAYRGAFYPHNQNSPSRVAVRSDSGNAQQRAKREKNGARRALGDRRGKTGVCYARPG